MPAAKQDANDNRLAGLERAPEIFVDGYRGVAVRGSVMRINFFANRYDPAENALSKVAAVTLAISVADFHDLVTGFNRMAETLLADGLVPPAEATAGSPEA